MSRVEKLLLSEQYVFEVNVQYKSDIYAGELVLTPDSIKLEIMGEDRNKDTSIMRDFWLLSDIEVLRAYNGNDSFLLYGVKPIRALSKTLNRVKGKGFFKIVLEIDYVIFSQSHLAGSQEFCSVSIYSSSIQNLIGRTSTQKAILETKKHGAEFVILTEGAEFCYAYNYHRSYSPTKKLEEIRPLLFSQIHGGFIEQLSIINDFFILFSFLNGSELDVEEIVLCREGIYSSLNSSFYYPKNRFLKLEVKAQILYPWHANEGIGIESFGFNESHLKKYFSLTAKEKSYFSKYLRYKRIGNIEERFLGYFRVLESCCREEGTYVDIEVLEIFIKKIASVIEDSFLSEKKKLTPLTQRLKGLNRQKYNTETCIRKLVLSIEEITKIDWLYSKNDIKSICDLRNNITHANSYSLDEIEPMTNFIESLLVFSLLKLLDVEAMERVKVLSRLDAFRGAIKYAS